MQRGVAKVLKVPCIFMITKVSIRCQKTRRLVYGVYPRIPPPQYTTAYVDVPVYYKSVFYSKRVPVDGLIWFWQGGFFQPVLH